MRNFGKLDVDEVTIKLNMINWKFKTKHKVQHHKQNCILIVTYKQDSLV